MMFAKIKDFFAAILAFFFKKSVTTITETQKAEQVEVTNFTQEAKEEDNEPADEMIAKCEMHVLYSPKLGCSEQEYEDAFYLPFTKSPNEISTCKVSIADGATESSFAKEWAKILTEGFATYSFEKNEIHNSLKELRQLWRKSINTANLPWYAQDKFQKGAFSAFLGLEVDFDKKKWKSLAVGDCCLFLVRDDKLTTSFPFSDYESFGNNPYAISSNQSQNLDIENHLIVIEHDFKRGDILILASDAIAAWFLKSSTEGKKIWDTVIDRFENEDFETWLNEQRATKEIKNDDTTLILIEFS